MRNLLLCAVVAFGVSAPAHAALKPGDPAPVFSAPATLGGKEFTFSLADALRHGPVVLYFYPAAFTKGCTEEAHDFAEAMPRFRQLGATVIGVSGDSIQTLDRFSVSECGRSFPVAADPHRAVMTRYDAVMIPLTGYASRTSYVITPDARILYVYGAMVPDQHVANTLAALTAWRAQHPVAVTP